MNIPVEISIESLGFKISPGAKDIATVVMEEYILPRLKWSKKDYYKAGQEIKFVQEYNLFHSLRYDTKTKVEPLSPFTIKKKGHTKVFFDKGILYQSVMLEADENKAEIFIADDRAQIAYWLCTGTKSGGKFMPPRPFFGVNDELVERIFKLINDKINGEK